MLVHYNSKLEVQLAVDASPVGLGAEISHITADGTERPIAWASRSLTKSDSNYSVIENEALAIIFGIRKFQQFLYGRRFTLLTDHQRLTLLFGSKKAIPAVAASRIQGWAIQLSAYQYDIKYRKSKQNANATRYPDFWVKEQMLVYTLTRNPKTSTGFKKPECQSMLNSFGKIQPEVLCCRESWPDKSEVPDNLKSYFAKRNEFTVEDGRMSFQRNESCDYSEASGDYVSRVTSQSPRNCENEIPS